MGAEGLGGATVQRPFALTLSPAWVGGERPHGHPGAWSCFGVAFKNEVGGAKKQGREIKVCLMLVSFCVSYK